MIVSNIVDIIFRDVRSCMLMGMLHITFASTVKQPVLTNSHSALTSWMGMYACITQYTLVLFTGVSQQVKLSPIRPNQRLILIFSIFCLTCCRVTCSW